MYHFLKSSCLITCAVLLVVTTCVWLWYIARPCRRQSSEPSYPQFSRKNDISKYIAFEVYPFFNHDMLHFYIWHFQLLLVVRQTCSSYSNVWCFHRIVLRNMREISRELHVCFFSVCKDRSHFSPIRTVMVDFGHSAHSQANCRITKTTRNVNVPWYDSLVNTRTVPAVNQTVVSVRGRQRAVF